MNPGRGCVNGGWSGEVGDREHSDDKLNIVRAAHGCEVAGLSVEAGGGLCFDGELSVPGAIGSVNTSAFA